jgi:hypothetical protein
MPQIADLRQRRPRSERVVPRACRDPLAQELLVLEQKGEAVRELGLDRQPPRLMERVVERTAAAVQ